jgi:amidohydrolase
MLKKAQKIASELISLRRAIHSYPELSFKEVRTAGLVADTLKAMGNVSVKTGVAKTGVVGEMGTGEGPTIAIRADMDALPILEQADTPYVSTRKGVMHACGHDAHTAILLGVARLLGECFATEDIKGNVRFLFQPSEENTDDENLSGAPRMIHEGALDGIDAVISLHVDSLTPCGQVKAVPGWTSAAVDTFKAWITAGGGHGAYPHETTDPIWLLGPVLTALHGIVARRIDPMEAAVVSLGEVHAGTASNIIPHEVYLHGTLRSFEPGIRDKLCDEMERALSVVKSLGGDYRLEISKGYPAGWNDPVVIDWLMAVSRDLLGSDSVIQEPLGMGAEDFACMCQKVPGAMIMLGAAIPDGTKRNHHTNTFDIDERSLAMGAAILTETARRFLTGKASLAK